jgi:hypothetical protein
MSAIRIPIIEDGLELVRTFDAAVAELKLGAMACGCELSALECTALLQTMEAVRLSGSGAVNGAAMKTVGPDTQMVATRMRRISGL